MSEPEIICEARGAVGLVTLNRPQALNALTSGMVDALAAALRDWARDPAIGCVVVRGAGGRAFSAGGDIRALYEAGRAGRIDEAAAFWLEEYLLNIAIKRFAKPYLALVGGIVMGGGVGVSFHGSHRVAGERFLFAMPEVGIGFFPDVGATWFLPRLPGETGTYLALTGSRIGPDDARALGLATHLAPTASFEAIVERLAAGEAPDDVLASLARPPGPSPLLAERTLIDRCFAAPSVAEILARLDREAEAGSAFARDAAATIRTKSPTSLVVALAQMRAGRDLDFEAAMALEFRIVNRIAAGHDFYEGVRATIIDKDGAPAWRPASLAELDPDEVVRAHVAPLGARELPVGPEAR
ncbi:MAG: enoyl-CoA hydratase/isomerase family protein [Methylobacteriaceae bacterium]|nr:enoyl-CoA hydratase/isomerase family protein [Methylobacteriaceae bacterium]